jgi:hypothetical protein
MQGGSARVANYYQSRTCWPAEAKEVAQDGLNAVLWWTTAWLVGCGDFHVIVAVSGQHMLFCGTISYQQHSVTE